MRMTRLIAAVITLLVAAGVPASASAVSGSGASPSAASAEVVFYNGRIHPTVTATATAMAIADGKVTALNDDALNVASATRIDLKGKHIFPGFFDSHVHALMTNFVLHGAPIQGTTSMAQIKSVLAAYIAATNPTGWIYGFGWDLSGETPSGLSMDDVTGDIPTVLFDRGGHTAIVNSAGMLRAGITEQTPDPPGGEFVRDSNGKLTGWLRESAAGLITQTVMEQLKPEEITAGLTDFLGYLAQYGVTSINDMAGTTGLYLPQIAAAYLRLAQTGGLPIRVNYFPVFYSPDDVERIAEWTDPARSTAMLCFGGGKVFVDGGFDTGGSFTSFAHAHNPIVYYRQSQLEDLVARADALGLTMHYHVNGDLAIDMALSAFEAAAAKTGGVLKGRHVLLHLGFATAGQRQRMRDLGIVAAVQPIFWHQGFDAMDLAEYGETYYEAYNYRALVEMGIPTGYGTDLGAVGMEQFPPLVGLRVAQSPKTVGNGNVRQLTAAEFIKGYTEGSALTVGRGDVGRLTVGMAADFFLTNRDLLTTPIDSLPAAVISETWVAGKRVWLDREADPTYVEYEPAAWKSPTAVVLSAAYPNPFNAAISVRFDMATAGAVQLGVYNLTGQPVCELAHQAFAAGSHTLTWNAVDADGRAVGSGVYLVRLVSAAGCEVRRVTLLR